MTKPANPELLIHLVRMLKQRGYSDASIASQLRVDLATVRKHTETN